MQRFSPKQPIHSTYSTEVSKIAWVSLFIGSGSRSERITKHIRILFFGTIIAWERLKWIIQFKGIRRIQFVDGSFPWIKIIKINQQTQQTQAHKTCSQGALKNCRQCTERESKAYSQYCLKWPHQLFSKFSHLSQKPGAAKRIKSKNKKEEMGQEL